MDNQHRKIAGYRDLSQAEIDLMNLIKAKGPEMLELLAKVEHHLNKQQDAAGLPEHGPNQFAEIQRLAAAEPKRWLAMARSDLQVGLMKLTRAVAQPTFF